MSRLSQYSRSPITFLVGGRERSGRRDAAVVSAERKRQGSERGSSYPAAREHLLLHSAERRRQLPLRPRRQAPPQGHREAKVGELEVAVLVDQDVLGLEVAAQSELGVLRKRSTLHNEIMQINSRAT